MSRQTLIERVAGKRYRIGWDEAARHEPGGKTHFEKRDMYQLIPCQYGDIYKFASGILAWYCPSRQKGTWARKRLGPWFTVQIECEDEWIFNFPAEKFPEVAKCANPRRRRLVSEEERQRLLDMGKAHHFTGAENKNDDPDAHIDAAPGLPPSPGETDGEMAA